MKSGSLAAAMAAFVASASLLLVAGCGGGVGSGGTGMAIGTINGFGSVVVDGVHYDDAAIASFREDAPGVQTQTKPLLGQRAQVRFTDDGVATALIVDAALVGTVSSVPAAGSFTVLGQSVISNADPALGPVTQFGGGYTGAASVVAGDAVEVHGVIVVQGAGFVVRATRVERLAALPTYLKATGIVSAGDAGSFALGGLRVDATSAVVVPAGASRADGAVVSVLAPAASLALDVDGSLRIVAAQVRVGSLAVDTTRVTLSGTVSALDAAAQRFTLAGVRVSYAGAAVSPSGSSLAGRYVVATGRRLDDGSLLADTVSVRDGTREPEAELKGSITDFVAAGSFRVRDVAVDASRAVLESCPAGGLANGVYVELQGSLAPTGVVATKVHCESEPSGATVERSGVVGNVDLSARTFVLTPSLGAPLQVRWTPITLFEDVTATSMAGKRVEVQGQFNGSELTAQQIEADD